MIRIRYKFYTELQTDSKHLYDKKLEVPHMEMFLEEKIPLTGMQSQCLKITQNVAFEFYHFQPIFCPITRFARTIKVKIAVHRVLDQTKPKSHALHC